MMLEQWCEYSILFKLIVNYYYHKLGLNASGISSNVLLETVGSCNCSNEFKNIHAVVTIFNSFTFVPFKVANLPEVRNSLYY